MPTLTVRQAIRPAGLFVRQGGDPTLVPFLILDFALQKALDSRLTFARASEATFFDAAGVLQSAAIDVPRFTHDPATGESLGLLMEQQSTNLFLRSEELDDAYWGKVNSTVTANATTAPDGAATADKLVETVTTGVHGYQRVVAFTSGTAYTCSVFAKAAERSSVLLRLPTLAFGLNSEATFNLATGTATGVNPGFTQSITALPNGWYRCTVTGTATTTISTNVAVLMGSSAGYAGDGTSGMFIWGAQIEALAHPTSYIKTVASTVTRSADNCSMTGTNFSSWYRADQGTLVTTVRPAALAAANGVVLNDGTINNRIRIAPASLTDQGTVTVGGTDVAVLDGGTPVARARTVTALAYLANSFALSLNGGAAVADTTGAVPTVNQMQIGASPGTPGNVTVARIAYYAVRLSDAQLPEVTQ